jgi:LDH2 family malate/lactate/ureidoglycolate dehydrogenase
MQISYPELHRFISEVFLKKGMSAAHARISADVLTSADLRGIDSHGVARLSGYLRLIDSGRINVDPNLQFERRKKTQLRLNADGAIGLVSAHLAMQECIKITHDYGTAWSGIYNSNHFGIAAHHAMLGFEHRYVGFAMTNASPLVVPANGTERMLGTNPICVAIPGKNGKSFVMDMASATAANGKLEIAQRKNTSIPQGWAIDAEGNPSKDPNILSHKGALLPLGSDAEHGFHKGYALGAWVDIFSAVLTGASWGPWAPPFVSFLNPSTNAPGKGLGHFVGCWDLDGFNDVDTAQDELDAWIVRFKTSHATQGHAVLIPGEPELLTHAQRIQNGIPINAVVAEEIRNISKELNVSL